MWLPQLCVIVQSCNSNIPIDLFRYIEILEKYKPKFSWEEASMEHTLKYK